MKKEELISFLKSTHFSRGLLATFAIIIPLLVGFISDTTTFATYVAVGALLNAPNNVPGSIKRRVNGTLISVILTTSITFIVLSVQSNTYLLPVVLGVLVFFVSLISVFGFRASLLSLSGLLAITLALSNDSPQLLVNTIGVAVGGLWYLALSFLFSSKRMENNLLAETLIKTGQFIQLRGRLLIESENRDSLFKEIYELETELIDNHETLREMLFQHNIFKKQDSNDSRQQVLISLIDILELAIAKSLNYKELDLLFNKKTNFLQPFCNFNMVLGEQLLALSLNVNYKTALPDFEAIDKTLNSVLKSIKEYTEHLGLPEARNGALTLHNLKDYQLKIKNEVLAIRRALNTVKKYSNSSITASERSKFITKQEYNLPFLLENINAKSPIFRHAIRMTFAVILGYGIGTYFGLKNVYWILLTLVVIMRPNYGLTKERTLKRLIGTVLGAMVAICVFYLTDNNTIFIGISIITLLGAFTFLQKKYQLSAFFITLTILFVYALKSHNNLEMVQFRVVDTSIGAIIALLVNYMVWPNWEHKNLNNLFQEVIKNNKNYLLSLKTINDKNSNLTNKLSRKEAFLSISLLNASLERFKNDPKSKQIDKKQVVEKVNVHHSILAAIASISTYLKSNNYTKLSKNELRIIEKIATIMEQAEAKMGTNTPNNLIDQSTINNKDNSLFNKFATLEEERNLELRQGKKDIEPALLQELQESHLLINQLTWLESLSLKL